MGRGDKKSRKGKIAMGSFGKSRPHQVKKAKPALPLQKEETPTATPEKTDKAKKPSA